MRRTKILVKVEEPVELPPSDICCLCGFSFSEVSLFPPEPSSEDDEEELKSYYTESTDGDEFTTQVRPQPSSEHPVICWAMVFTWTSVSELWGGAAAESGGSQTSGGTEAAGGEGAGGAEGPAEEGWIFLSIPDEVSPEPEPPSWPETGGATEVTCRHLISNKTK